MEIKLKEVTVGDVAKGYKDNGEDGVVGYNGLLNIRPAYQREFVYKDKQRDAVMDTILRGYPLNTIYWVKNNDGTFEVLDGQQRTISFCSYVHGDYSIPDKSDGHAVYFHNLTEEQQARILSYKLFIYVCEEGDDKERLDWFRTINIAGEALNEQELLNANYTGEWLSHAKRLFSKTNCNAYKIGSKYVKGSPIRQDYLSTALSWISDGNTAEYMAKHQFDKDAGELWTHYDNIIRWIGTVFTVYRKEMAGLDWGSLYRTYHENRYNPVEVEAMVKNLMEDDEVTEKKGIYEYVLSGCSEHIARRLSKRQFSMTDKRTAYERQNGRCPVCGEEFQFEEMDGDHITAWWRGGKTVLDNLQMVCKKCNGAKGGKSY